MTTTTTTKCRFLLEIPRRAMSR